VAGLGGSHYFQINNGLRYTATTAGLINIYNMSNDHLVRSLAGALFIFFIVGHDVGCKFVLLDDDGFLYSSGDDKLVKKWDLQTGELVRIYSGTFFRSH
jgi:WD40 repeat protein